MKPLGVKNYGSIGHLSNSKLGAGDHYIDASQERMFTQSKKNPKDFVIVTEKYDGSNVGICRHDGKVIALTRSGYVADTSKYPHHIMFNDWVSNNERMFDFLQEGERVAGEWLALAHGMRYNIETDPILFFDYFDAKNNRYSFAKLVETGLPTVRLIHAGDPISVADCLPKLAQKTNGFESEDLPEGLVYRVERNSKFIMCAKWVRSDFQNGKYLNSEDESQLVWNVTKFPSGGIISPSHVDGEKVL